MLLFLVLFPMAAGVISYLLGRKQKEIRNIWVRFATLLEFGLSGFCLVNFMNTGVVKTASIPEICGMGISFTTDSFRLLYATLAAFMWAMTGLLSKEYFRHHQNRNRYYLYFMVTLTGILGVFFSADLYTTFIFFELMSFTSYVWVAQEESKEALRAAQTYLAVAVIGGLVMLMGIFLLWSLLHTLQISELLPAIQEARETLAGAELKEFQTILYAAGGCMLFGFGAKAGMFPLHIWLPKAHPVAPAPASALLSGMLTKAGIFGILILAVRVFAGNGVWGSLVLSLGVITMMLGAVLAIFSENLKRTLACSSVSQIGFILVGVGLMDLLGEENVLAAAGSLLHMVNHSLFKLILFMLAGAVYMKTHALELSKVQGFGRKNYFLHAVFLMGALGIAGVPFWSGFVSKSLLHEGMVEYIRLLQDGQASVIWFSASGMKILEWCFLFSGGMTFAYMLKLYVCLFWKKNADRERQMEFEESPMLKLQWGSKIALGVSAVLPLLFGLFPGVFMTGMANLGGPFLGLEEKLEGISYFSLENLKGAVISLSLGALLYLLVIRSGLTLRYRGPRIDLEDQIYRPVLCRILPFVFGVLCRIPDCAVDTVVVFLRKTVFRDSPLPRELEEGNYFTHVLGCFLDGIRKLFYRLRKKPLPDTPSMEHRLANRYEDLHETGVVMSRSLSFGLVIFCIGWTLTIVYILFW